MSTKIEFHMIQSFPPANLNRDDTNMPKDCEFGGVRRARISSQCLKRSIRLHPDFEKYTEVPSADRTRRLISPIQEKLVKTGMSSQDSLEAASAFVSELLGGLDKQKENEEYPRSKVLFYVSNEEIDSIVKAILENGNEKKDYGKLVKNYIKEFSLRTSAPDIALFGRMLADNPNLSMEASCQVAHAISTHRVNMEMDFFTAVDDLQQVEDPGAGMMGITGFNAATFYRYAAIDWGQLMDNLDGKADLAKKTVCGFLSAMAKAVPTGKQNAFAAQTPPSMILVVVREDEQAWSLVNAFEKPITTKGNNSILHQSVAVLDNHWHELDQIYGDPKCPTKPFVLALPEIEGELNYLKGAKVGSLLALEDAVSTALPQEG
jgi:CRISPR system Cascade subunit CasC